MISRTAFRRFTQNTRLTFYFLEEDVRVSQIAEAKSPNLSLALIFGGGCTVEEVVPLEYFKHFSNLHRFLASSARANLRVHTAAGDDLDPPQ